MRLNTAQRPQAFTHEGAPAFHNITAEQRLRRSVLACLLWERQFYEDGEGIAKRIQEAAREVDPQTLADLAIEARGTFNLRHAPLMLLSVLSQTGRGSHMVADAIEAGVQRADELTELLAIHAEMNGVTPDRLKPVLPAQMKKGLARAFRKFDEYQFAKYDRAGAIKLRDALFLCHAKPKDKEQEALWRRLVDGTLTAPDTWEVGLSAGADKRETFERLLREGKLGYLALLRNLRNMTEAGVDSGFVRDAILARKGAKRVLPFRYVAAARACPQMEPALDEALSEAISEMPPLSGKTVVLVDVSGSMTGPLSGKSDMTRMDAAAALGAIVHGDIRVLTFSNQLVEVPPRRGMAGVDAIIRSQPHGCTCLGEAVQAVNEQIPHDRLIVITDEQAHPNMFNRYGRVPDPVATQAYMINVASYENGVGYGRWVHIDGFSEAVLRYIHAYESERA